MKAQKHLILFTATLALVIISSSAGPNSTQASNLTAPEAIYLSSNQPEPSPLLKQPAPNCDNAQSQQEMNICAGEEAKRADARLNQVYRQLRDRIKGTPQGQRLQNAQIAWLKYRDADCEYAQREFDGGSMMPMMYAYCVSRLTQDRTKILEEYLDNTDH